MGQRKKTASDIRAAAATGKRLREAREMWGLTQTELGALLGKRSQRTINKYESGESTIPLPVLLKVCRELGFRLEWLAEGTLPMLSNEEHFQRGIYWIKCYGSRLRLNLLDGLEAAANDPSVDQRIRKACELVRSALREVPEEEVTLGTFERIPLELIRSMNVLLTDRAPQGESSIVKRERQEEKVSQSGPRRPIDELSYLFGGGPLPSPTDGDKASNKPIAEETQEQWSRRAEETFKRLFPGWSRGGRKRNKKG